MVTVFKDFNDGPENNFSEGYKKATNQPNVNHLGVRCGGQISYLAGEDGGHHQHDGQIYGKSISK